MAKKRRHLGEILYKAGLVKKGVSRDDSYIPDDVKKAIGITPHLPQRIARQATLKERIYSVGKAPLFRKDGTMALSDAQYREAKAVIREIFS